MTKLYRAIRPAIFAAAASTILAGAALAPTTPAVANASFDGNWSVLIVTKQGECDRAYRYAVRISNGTVGYAGEAAFTVSGKVDPNGAVRVRVSRGQQHADGKGRLTASGGSGSWSGGSCSGVWTAERR